jgi:DNA invertase Pin-like site-specific DNA recombinase
MAATREYAEKHGLELDESLAYRDEGRSGFDGTNVRRGALGRFLAAIDAEEVAPGSVLLVESLDRVSRQDPWDALPIFQLIINAGVTIVTLQDGRVWSREEMRANQFRLFESLFVMVRAHEESATKSRRLKAAWQNKRANAGSKPLTARAPAWLELTPQREWSVRAERAEVVRRIYRMAANGVGEHTIAATLNRENVPTFGDGNRKAQHWNRSYIAKLLRSPSTVGTLIPSTIDKSDGRKVRTAQDPVEGYFPAIVDRDLYESVRALKHDTANPQRGRHASSEVQNVLGGLAQCPLCGRTMTRHSKGSSTKSGKAYLVCTGAKAGVACRYRAVPVEHVEAALVASADWLAETGPAGLHAKSLKRSLRDNLSTQREESAAIARLVKAIREGEDDHSPALRDALNEAERRIVSLKADERDIRERIGLTDSKLVGMQLESLREKLKANPLNRSEVNVALRHLVSGAVVDYRSGLLLLKWKHGGESHLRFAEAEDPEKVPDKWKAAARFFARNRGTARTPPGYMPLPKLKPPGQEDDAAPLPLPRPKTLRTGSKRPPKAKGGRSELRPRPSARTGSRPS